MSSFDFKIFLLLSTKHSFHLERVFGAILLFAILNVVQDLFINFFIQQLD